MTAKITISRINNGTTLTTYQLNNFDNLTIDPVNTPEIIPDPTGDETTAILTKFTGTTMKIIIDSKLITETSNVVVGGVLTQNTSTGTNGASTLNDTKQAWTTNQFANETVTITGGTGNGQTKTIVSNTSTQLTISGSWSVTPDATSTYVINITSPVGQLIYLMKQFNSVGTTYNNTTFVPILDSYTLTLDFGETNARTFVESGSIGEILTSLASADPINYNVHMDFLIGSVPTT